jgi:trehalose-6-phosphate synthase
VHGAVTVDQAYRRAFPGHRLLVVSNREPYEHYWDESADDVAVRRPAGGLVAALDPLMQAVGGTWIAWGSGDRDTETADAAGHVPVPPEAPSYTLRRLWLNQQDIHQYYFGYSNQFLWPLCHLRPALTRTRLRYWERYVAVNRSFAQAVIDEAGAAEGAAAVWLQDYHLAVAPALIRRRRPDLTLAHFWHIPFPPLEIFRVASNGAELLEGLLANDLVGFHLPLFCDNFLRCAESILDDAIVDWDTRSVEMAGRRTFVRAFPISIDVDAFRSAAQAPGADARIERLRARYAPGDVMLGLGVDRIDYSKGLEEKLHALEILFDAYPQFRERFTYVQIAVPSRTGIEMYDWLNEKLERQVWSINDRYGTSSWRPVHLLKESLPFERLALYYRAADVCMISSLQDGMNLVAKEFVASQVDQPGGVLLLSRFAGAAAELDGSFDFNPYDPESAARDLAAALVMPAAERRERMQRLNASLRTIYDWMAEVFTVWGAISGSGSAPLSVADRWRRSR